jgi:uncharacterized membrane protein
MNIYSFIKFLHILCAMLMVGGMFARQMVRAYAKKSQDVHIVATLLRAAGQLDRRLVIPSSNLVILIGIILAILVGWPILGFMQGASQNWLLVSTILVIAILVVVFAVFVPRNRKLEPLIEAALAQGEVTPDLQLAMDDQVVRWAHHFEEVAVIVIVALMVFKPI